MKSRTRHLITISILVIITLVLSGCTKVSKDYIINVSYDPTREFYEEYNELFIQHWRQKTGNAIEVIQSHGGSGKQALEVSNGLEADVVTLALEADIQEIADSGLIEDGFTAEFPGDSSPYTSTIVFLVRANNPKNIYDWNDLLRDDVGVITPNPKTSGGARWNYLAAWYYFQKQGLSETEILDKMTTLYSNVKVLDSGARASTTSFVENGQGDVLLAWENEAFLTLQSYPDEYEIVVPSVSILCQPTVALVDEMTTKHDTTDVATEYLNYLYSDDAQNLAANNYYRPISEQVKNSHIVNSNERTIKALPTDGRWIIDDIDLVDINYFGGWKATTAKHFADGGYFDSIYE